MKTWLIIIYYYSLEENAEYLILGWFSIQPIFNFPIKHVFQKFFALSERYFCLELNCKKIVKKFNGLTLDFFEDYDSYWFN